MKKVFKTPYVKIRNKTEQALIRLKDSGIAT